MVFLVLNCEDLPLAPDPTEQAAKIRNRVGDSMHIMLGEYTVLRSKPKPHACKANTLLPRNIPGPAQPSS